MNTREKFEDMLVNMGMFESQAKQVMELKSILMCFTRLLLLLSSLLPENGFKTMRLRLGTLRCLTSPLPELPEMAVRGNS